MFIIFGVDETMVRMDIDPVTPVGVFSTNKHVIELWKKFYPTTHILGKTYPYKTEILDV
jgi:hypothetical protein